MLGVRLNGLLASTAIALLLSAGTGVFAQQASPPGTDPVSAAPVDATPASSPDTGKATGTPDLAAPATAATPTTTPAAGAASASPSAPQSVGGIVMPPAEAATGTAAAPASSVPPTLDGAIADQLRQLDSGKFDRVLGGKAQRTAIQAFYSGRSFAPIWITDGQENDRAKSAATYLSHVDSDGLDPADYAVPDFKSTDPAALAEAELRFSMTLITYAKHASIGRVAWSRVDANIEYDTKPPEPAAVLAALADAKDVGSTLDSYEPHAAGYLALKQKLAEIRDGKGDGAKPPIANGPVLKIGSQDDRVPELRDRLGVPGDGGTTYDKALADAVKDFQKAHELKPTGTLTAQTIDAINGPRPAHETDIILANMERWRWIPHDLGTNYIMINLPDYTAAVFHDDKRIWKTKIVIGKTDMPTPLISTSMKFITVNPTWHVPPSIINREYLPAMAQDPTVMQRMGLVVQRDNWGKVTGIYQPPGDRNAEGRLRFNFPNKFDVYQHDTPDKYMFAYAKRAFSHGCMRTQDPAKYAEVLLSLVRPNDGYTKERIEHMYGPSEINIEFPTFIPIHVTYQTAFVDDEGKLQFRDDVYGRDRQLLAILHSPAEMRVADVPVAHAVSAVKREILNAGDHAPTWGDPYGGGGGFFARLFGGFQQPAPPPRAVGQRRRVVGSRNTIDR